MRLALVVRHSVLLLGLTIDLATSCSAGGRRFQAARFCSKAKPVQYEDISVTLYSVFERPAPTPEAPAVVPEKFSWLAALLPPVFGLVHGLWLELIAFVVALAMIVLVGFWLGGDAAFWLYVLLAVFIGFEAPSLRRGALRRKGWSYRTELLAQRDEQAQIAWLQRRGVAP
jgi:hypothetical protein